MSDTASGDPAAAGKVSRRGSAGSRLKFWFELLVGLSGIVGIPLSVLLFYLADNVPVLSYDVQPGTSHFTFPGREPATVVIGGNSYSLAQISAVRVRVRNIGRGVLRREDTRGLGLSLGAGYPILAANIVTPARPICNFDLNDPAKPGVAGGNTMPAKEIFFSFNLMAPEDEAVVELVYDGPPTTDVRMSGATSLQTTLKPLSPNYKVTQSHVTPPPIPIHHTGDFVLFAISILLVLARYAGGLIGAGRRRLKAWLVTRMNVGPRTISALKGLCIYVPFLAFVVLAINSWPRP